MVNRKKRTCGPGPRILCGGGAWAWAAAIACAVNMALFAGMPYLLDRKSPQPVYDQLIPDINIVRIPRPETEDAHKSAPPPEEPPQERAKVRPQAPSNQAVMAKLTLPLDINPRLPSGPAAVALPPIQQVSFGAQDLDGLFGAGDLDGPLTPLVRIPPVYPMNAKRRGIEGWVKVKFMVNADGTVEHVQVTVAEPSGIFDRTVIRCVSRWRFKPGTVAGKPVKAWLETTVRFQLEQS